MLPESLIHICGHPVALEEELRVRFRQVYGAVSRAVDEALPTDLTSFLNKYDSKLTTRRLTTSTAVTDTPTSSGRNALAAHAYTTPNHITYEDGDMTTHSQSNPHLTNVTTTTKTAPTASITVVSDLERELLEEVTINLTPEYCIRQRTKCVAAAEAVVAEFTCRREALIPSILPE